MSHNPRANRGCQVIHDSLLRNKSQMSRPLYTLYDGYLIEKVTADGTTTYDYGTLGELLEVQTPTQTITYKHNANNQRVSKLVDGTITEKYLWANLTTLLAIYDDNALLVSI